MGGDRRRTVFGGFGFNNNRGSGRSGTAVAVAAPATAHLVDVVRVGRR